MKHIRQRTSIPVPRVWLSFGVFDSWYILMDRVPRAALCAVDWNTLSAANSDKIIDQLRNFVSELRSLPPPASPQICSLMGIPLLGHRLHHMEPFGPYEDEAEMTYHLRVWLPSKDIANPT